MNRRISVRGIALLDGKLLCVKLKPYNGVSVTMANSWCLPGGGLEEGEPLLDGVRREMIEETGITPVIDRLLYVQQFDYNNKDYLEFFFHITNAADYLSVDLTQSTHGVTEIEAIDFVDPHTTPLLPLFLMSEDLPAHAAANGPVKFFAKYE